jgi:hypothetical protein
VFVDTRTCAVCSTRRRMAIPMASFLPNQGRLTVTPKQDGTFYVRVPGFAPRDQVAACRDGQKADNIVWTHDYVTFASARKGEELTVTYPLVKFAQKMKVAGADYTIYWKGNAVTSIEPKGKVWPLFATVPYPMPSYNGEAASRNIPRKIASETKREDSALPSKPIREGRPMRLGMSGALAQHVNARRICEQ